MDRYSILLLIVNLLLPILSFFLCAPPPYQSFFKGKAAAAIYGVTSPATKFQSSSPVSLLTAVATE